MSLSSTNSFFCEASFPILNFESVFVVWNAQLCGGMLLGSRLNRNEMLRGKDIKTPSITAQKATWFGQWLFATSNAVNRQLVELLYCVWVRTFFFDQICVSFFFFFFESSRMLRMDRLHIWFSGFYHCHRRATYSCCVNIIWRTWARLSGDSVAKSRNIWHWERGVKEKHACYTGIKSLTRAILRKRRTFTQLKNEGG